jgi:hypothetical protein
MVSTPRWPELIVLMCFGQSEERPFTGVVEVDDRYDDEEDDVALPGAVRVHKKGARYRVESIAGDLLYIRGSDRSWRFPRGGGDPGLVNQDDKYEGGSYGFAIERPDPTNWRGGDFTTPTGPLRPTTYLGMDAWQVELAPPAHKPAPVELIVDQHTGMVLRWGDSFRWTQVDQVDDLADSLFEWDGSFFFASSDDGGGLPDDIVESLRRSDAERRTRIAALGVTQLRLDVSADPEAYSAEDDGSFHVTYDVTGFVQVRRRPHDDTTWDLDGPIDRWSTWTEGAWDWAVALSDIDRDQVPAIRRQLVDMLGRGPERS